MCASKTISRRCSSSRLTVAFRGLVLVTMCMVLFVQQTFSQDAESNRQQIEHIIEQLISDLDPEESEQEILELIEWIESLAANPVNINRAGVDELSGLPGIDFRIAREIVNHRENVKPFEHLDELRDISGVGRVSLQNIRPFLTVGSGRELGQDLYLNRRFWTAGSRAEAMSRIETVLEDQEGFNRPDSLTHYQGSPFKYNHRIRYRSRRLSLNLAQDKDPGEPMNGITGFDYTSWHVGVNGVGYLQNLVIGDYRASFAQGLILWTGGSFGKSSQVRGAAVKNDPGIRPYTSSQETNAFRGVAATIGGRLQFSGFYSNRKRTASEIDDQFVRFPTATGLHRTQNELQRRNNLGQETYGGRLRYRFNRGLIGISGFQNEFSRPVQRGTQPYQIHQFEGQYLSAMSVDFKITAGPALLFGEAGRTGNGGTGLIGGSEFRLENGTDISLAYRNYSADFQSIFGSGFGEQSRTQNEEGFYLGLQQDIGSSLLIRSYADLFRTHAPRFRNSMPTSGFDGLIRIDFTPKPELRLFAQYRMKRQEQEIELADTFGRTLPGMSHTVRSNARFQAEYQILPTLRLRTRFDVVRARETVEDPSYGFLIFQDVRFTPNPKLTADARITLFDTKDFNSRVFQFENDLLYVMSNTMLFDQGQRMYIVIRYQPVDPVTIRFKAATTLYENRQTIGSGLDEIRGNRRSDLGMQVRILF